MSKDDELRGVLDQAAIEISDCTNNPRAWLSWILYLLARLEQQSQDASTGHKQAYIEMLSALQDAIKNRLRTGGW